MSLIDLTGRTFGRLTVVKRVENSRAGEPRWECQCECGKVIVAQGANLRSGHTSSCGCYAKKRISETQTTHGGTKTRLYYIWRHMRGRCLYAEDEAYANYGGRGITICEEWRDNFVAFRDWALANGYADNLTIDRINNDGNYEPSNCRWATAKEQSNNRRNNRVIECRGVAHTLEEWAEITGIKSRTIRQRITAYKWPVWKALGFSEEVCENG